MKQGEPGCTKTGPKYPKYEYKKEAYGVINITAFMDGIFYLKLILINEKMVKNMVSCIRRVKIMLCAVAIVLFASSIGWATTYFVDYDNGGDSNDGISISSPFKHCPGDNNAVGEAGSTNLYSGDKVIFKGGTIYQGRIDIESSGASDSEAGRIIYQGNTDALDWGIGKAIIDGQNTRYRGFSAGSPRSYITIKNFEIRNMADNSDSNYPAGIGFTNSSPNNYITIEDCYIHDIGYWNNDGGSLRGSISGSGIKIFNANNCVIVNNELTKTAKAGIALHGAANCVISRNKLHHYINWGIDISCDYRQSMDNLVTNNVLYDMYQYDAGFWTGGGDGPHSDWIFIRKGGSGGGISNQSWAQLRTVVEKNVLYNNYNFTSFGGTAMITVARSKHVSVRNNVVINAHSYNAVQLGWESWDEGHKVYNNIIYSPRSGVNALRLSDGFDHEVKNNIFIADRIITLGGGVTVSSDYNIYYARTPSLGWLNSGWSNWLGYGHDAHSTRVNVISDIKLVDTSGYPTSCDSMDLRALNNSSIVVNSGTTLVGFSDDKDSIARPQGAAWDIGAYEYPGVPPVGEDTIPPKPPTGLVIISIN